MVLLGDYRIFAVKVTLRIVSLVNGCCHILMRLTKKKKKKVSTVNVEEEKGARQELW